MKWYHKYLNVYEKSYDDIDHDIIQIIKTNLKSCQSDSPLVTVSVIAYNEEKHLLSCLWSLSEMICKYPVEIIGIDNDSKDKTREIFKILELPFYVENKHSCGHARLCGLTHAKGKYHINIDADTIYPQYYVEKMVDQLSKPGIVAACSSWSYIPDDRHHPISLFLYEQARDLYLYLQSFKRPELSVRGLVFAYHTTLAQKIGIRVDIIRGEDGSLANKLKEFGKISFIYDRKARAITGYGTVGIDGSLSNSFKVRVTKAIMNIRNIFTKQNYYKDEDSNIVK